MYDRVYGPYKTKDGYRVELRQGANVVQTFVKNDWGDAVALGKSYRASLRAEGKKPKKKASAASKGQPFLDMRAWLALLWKRSQEAESRVDAEILRSLAAAIREAKSCIVLADPAALSAAEAGPSTPDDLRNMPQEELEALARQHLRVVEGGK